MKRNWALVIIPFFLILGLGAVVVFWPSEKAIAPTTDEEENPLSDLIRVTTPQNGATISSPLAISGEARGFWYFEASFPIELHDADGNIIAIAPAQAEGEWMTENFVPFSLSLPFPMQPAGSTGTLVLKKDNPSGDPERDQSITIPVTF